MLLKNDTLKDYEGKPMKAEGKEIDVKTIIINALNFEDDKTRATAEQKVRAYFLSVALMTNNEVKLKAEDIVFIKERLLRLYTPLIFGQIMSILEQETEK